LRAASESASGSGSMGEIDELTIDAYLDRYGGTDGEVDA
jgi:hypothetical protein